MIKLGRSWRIESVSNRTFLCLALLFAGCIARKEKIMSSGTQLPFIHLQDLNWPHHSLDDGERTPTAHFGIGPQGYILRSEDALKRLGFEVDSSPKERRESALNSLDWSQFSLVILTLGVQGTTGHTLKIDWVKKTEDTLTFAITHVEPIGPVGEALTHPASMIKLEKLPAGVKPVLKINGNQVACNWHVLN